MADINGSGLREEYYGPKDNERRNGAKRKALSQASGHMAVVAHTGWSYLYPDAGTGFYSDLEAYLQRSARNRLVVVLMNPFSFPALEFYLNLVRCYGADRNASPNPIDLMAFWALKLQQAHMGYIELDGLNSQVDLRLTWCHVKSTVLWTDTECFVEHYHNTDLRRRAQHRLDTSDRRYDPFSTMGLVFRPGEVMGETTFLMENSDSYDHWRARRGSYAEYAHTQIKMMKTRGQLDARRAAMLSQLIDRVHRLLDDRAAG